MEQGTSMIIMLVLMFAIMYFLMIRPENKRKKKAQDTGIDPSRQGSLFDLL